MNGIVRTVRSKLGEWTSMQYDPDGEFRIQIRDPPDVISDIAGATVEVALQDGTVKTGDADWSGGVSFSK